MICRIFFVGKGVVIAALDDSADRAGIVIYCFILAGPRRFQCLRFDCGIGIAVQSKLTILEGFRTLFTAGTGFVIGRFRSAGCIGRLVGFGRHLPSKAMGVRELWFHLISAFRTQDWVFLRCVAIMIRSMRCEIALFRAVLRLAFMPVAACIFRPFRGGSVISKRAISLVADRADRSLLARRRTTGVGGSLRLGAAAGIHLPVTVAIRLPIPQSAGVIARVLLAVRLTAISAPRLFRAGGGATGVGSLCVNRVAAGALLPVLVGIALPCAGKIVPKGVALGGTAGGTSLRHRAGRIHPSVAVGGNLRIGRIVAA